MNSKRTNWLVLICSFLLLIVFFYIVKCTYSYMLEYGIRILYEEEKTISYYGIKIGEIFYIYIKLVFIIQALAVIIPNIVAAIENIKYKRLAICQFLLGIVGILYLVGLDTEDILYSRDILSIITYTAIPVILMIIQVIILVREKENVEENGIRKKINIVLFYILQLAITIILLIAIISSVGLTKIEQINSKNRIKDLKSENSSIDNFKNDETPATDLKSKISSIDSFKNDEILITVRKNGKYGFVNFDGKEVVPCDYDLVSYFSYLDMKKTYCAALAKDGEKFYIISKDNYKIEIDDEQLDREYNDTYQRRISDEDNPNDYWKLDSFDSVYSSYFNYELYGRQSELVLPDIYFHELAEKIEPVYNYKNDNSYIKVEEIEDKNQENDRERWYRVTLTNKKNNKSTSYEVFLNMYDNRLYIYDDGSIGFTSLEGEIIGWCDKYGGKFEMYAKTVKGHYEIYYIENGKTILIERARVDGFNEDIMYRIVDINGRILYESKKITCFPDFFITLNTNNKFVMMDYDLNIISDEYDMIEDIENE